jgi:hypothetical protein
MQSKAVNIEEYLSELPDDKKGAVAQLHQLIIKNLPKGYQPHMGYGMLCYSIPHSIYPAGYHCSPELPLPFMSLAAQKNSINLYHMGIYANPELLKWFQDEFPKHCKTKLDMGKSCIRFKKPDQIPFELIAELCQKITVEEYIKMYETNYKR